VSSSTSAPDEVRLLNAANLERSRCQFGPGTESLKDDCAVRLLRFHLMLKSLSCDCGREFVDFSSPGTMSQNLNVEAEYLIILIDADSSFELSKD